MIDKRKVDNTDHAFLFQLYVSTRMQELEAWGWDEMMQQQFLHMQWTAQQRSYATQFPDAEHLLISIHARPAGRIMIARSDTSLTLVDISLLPAFQNKGIGTTLIQELQAEAADLSRPLFLNVLPENPAIRLYGRLGFQQVEHTGLHIRMKWTPTPSGEGPF